MGYQKGESKMKKKKKKYRNTEWSHEIPLKGRDE
jgi:hypothetical protein